MLSPNPPAWVAAYVGAPYADDARTGGPPYNCWALVAAVLAREFGFDSGEYDGPLWNAGGPPRERDAAMGDGAKSFARRMIEGGAEGFAARFAAVAAGAEQEGDLILMRVRGHPIHVGVVTAPGEMLHIVRGADACREDYRGRVWAQRVVGFYRPIIKAAA